MKKQFNLEEALQGAKLVTRDGREVTEWKYFESCEGDYPIAAVIDGKLYWFTKEGSYVTNKEDHYLNLFILTEPKKCYINVYGDRYKIWGGSSWVSFEEAYDKRNTNNYIKTIEITDEN